jgi:hypothetical protein
MINDMILDRVGSANSLNSFDDPAITIDGSLCRSDGETASGADGRPR